MKRIWIAAVAAGALAVLAPSSLVAQVDANGNPVMGPQNPQNQNLPSGQPGYSNQTGSASNNAATMRDSLGAPGMTGQQMEDKRFLQDATQGGLAEVQLGKLAEQKGSPEVKTFAQKVVDDHTSINLDLASVADSLGIMLPKKMNKDDEEEYAKLNNLSGDDFDKEYILAMAKAHRADFRQFRMESTVAVDPTLQSDVARGATIIRSHLMMLDDLAKAKNVTLPARPPRPGGPPPPPAGQ